MLQKTKSQIEEKLSADVIEPSGIELARPVVFAPKTFGKWRFCVNYRRMNQETIPDRYPLPRLDDCLDSLEDAKILPTLDAMAGYWPIPIRQEDRDKTTFTTHIGTDRYEKEP